MPGEGKPFAVFLLALTLFLCGVVVGRLSVEVLPPENGLRLEVGPMIQVPAEEVMPSAPSKE